MAGRLHFHALGAQVALQRDRAADRIGDAGVDHLGAEDRSGQSQPAVQHRGLGPGLVGVVPLRRQIGRGGGQGQVLGGGIVGGPVGDVEADVLLGPVHQRHARGEDLVGVLQVQIGDRLVVARGEGVVADGAFQRPV